LALSTGTRLGPYEIAGPIGAGGMGEVYRAKDTRLDRTVAIKVLPTHFATNSDLRQRFEREAKTVSSLNHPNICTLFDVGQEGETDFLVMEYLDGESLADRLLRGPLPLGQAIKHAVEIADGLDRAHRSGVIHRDLKPGNVMLTKSGAKLLDFGLAKMSAPGTSGGVSALATAEKPLTEAGTLLGTFQYMAPEQLEGRDADARSDVFAFGALLYEMITGRKAFAGKSQASLISSIMGAEPAPLSAIVPMTPPALERVVRTCLAKDADDRWQSAHDVAAELRWISEAGSQAGVPAPVVARRRSRERWAWALVALLALAAAAAAGALLGRRGTTAAATRFSVQPPQSLASMNWPRLSPDGRTLAFLGVDAAGKTRIWLRPMSALEPYALAGTDGATRPFWSPDSRYLAFFVSNQLKKVAAAGGPPQLICEAKSGSDGSWSKGDVILFDGGPTDEIRRVSASGGVPANATAIDKARSEVNSGWPWFLPDGRHFLFVTDHDKGGSWLKLGVLDSLQAQEIEKIESRVEYVAGHVLYVSQGTLVARPFSTSKLKFTGEPFPVAEKVFAQAQLAHFSTSQNGALAYMPGAGITSSTLTWTDLTGKELGKVGEPGAYHDMALSPDGTRLAVGVVDARANSDDLWVYDLKRNVASRLTFDPGNEIWPVWSPDGTHVAYATDKGGSFAVVQRLASGAGEEESIYEEKGANIGPGSWSRDGRFLACAKFVPGSAPDIIVIPMTGERKPIVFLATSFAEQRPAFSPDGRWLAYMSDESGRPEVYVQAFPPSGGKWQISTNGGRAPAWRGDGREIFFHMDGAGTGDVLMSVPVTSGVAFEAGIPKRLFERTLDWSGIRRNRWLVTPDGQRLLLNAASGASGPTGFNVVLDWTAELAKK
jgi:Tol biopolymer transport system component/predicted Ser/Thr protein kinase